MEKLKVKLLSDKAFVPTRAHETDAGLDFYATEDVEIHLNRLGLVYTNVAIALPKQTVGLMLDRGSMSKNGLTVVGGVFDEEYRGEVIIGLANVANTVGYTIKRGDKVAQLVIMPILTPEVELVEMLDDTNRGEKRWGSSGR